MKEKQSVEGEPPKNIWDKVYEFNYQDYTFSIMKKNQIIAAKRPVPGIKLSVIDPTEEIEYGYFTGTLKRDREGRTCFSAFGTVNNTYDNSSEHIAGLMGEAI